uniref:G_PROTEIN_RECEP_F1_2 domain-containing protein n=1 Tax=Syphacia muris TaxID=451379 RepID=A0A158R5B4_9BILA
MSGGGFIDDNGTETLFMCYLYIVIGPLAIFASLINLSVFLLDKRMRTTYILNIALYFGEIGNGISYIMTGYGRGALYYQGIFGNETTVHDCFFNHNWPIPLIMGTEIPAMLVVVISFERILAVTKPAWFNRNWKISTKLFFIFLVIVLQVLSIIVASYSAKNNYRTVNSGHCAIIDSTSKAYSTIHFTLIALAYVISFVSLVIVYLATRTKHSPKESRPRNSGLTKRQQLLLMIFFTASSVVLISAPGALMMGVLWELFAASDIAVGIIYSSTAFNTLVTTTINICLREDYRRQISKFLHCNFSERKISGITFVTSHAVSIKELGFSMRTRETNSYHTSCTLEITVNSTKSTKRSKYNVQYCKSKQRLIQADNLD